MLEGKTILVVEDEDSLRNIYTEWLREEKATIRTAETAEEALQEWNENVDAVMLDRRLRGGKNGDSVLDQKRTDGLSTPVAMLTAIDPDFNLTKMDIDDYLMKPISKEKLVEVLEDLFKVDEIDEDVRQFIRVGLKIKKLQSQYESGVLETHEEYHRLKNEYQTLLERLSSRDSLSEQDQRALLQAKQEVGS